MKVVCTLFKDNVVIDGIKFAAHKLGTISEEISDEIGERLLTLKGFLRVGPPPKATAALAAADAPAVPAPTPAAPATPASTPATPAVATATAPAAK